MSDVPSTAFDLHHALHTTTPFPSCNRTPPPPPAAASAIHGKAMRASMCLMHMQGTVWPYNTILSVSLHGSMLAGGHADQDLASQSHAQSTVQAITGAPSEPARLGHSLPRASMLGTPEGACGYLCQAEPAALPLCAHTHPSHSGASCGMMHLNHIISSGHSASCCP